MATSGDIVKKVVDKVLGHIQEQDPETFQKLNADGSKKDELIAKVKQIAEDEIAHGKELKRNGGDVTKLNLPPCRLAAIQDGLKMATYRVDIADRVAKHTFTDGTHFMTVQLDTQPNKDYSYYVQVASIVIEGVLLALTIIGLKVPVSKAILKKATEELVEELGTSSAFRKAVEEFVKSWEDASGNLDKAKALFYLLKNTYSLGILWKLIKTLCSEMSWWDWTKAAALITAQLIAAFATDGLALVAKIALALNSAYEFFKKIHNLSSINKA